MDNGYFFHTGYLSRMPVENGGTGIAPPSAASDAAWQANKAYAYPLGSVEEPFAAPAVIIIALLMLR